jgi:propionate CoA-transferase
VLEEIAPGVDLQRDVLDLMQFKPIISQTLKTMDEKIFYPELMKIGQERNERTVANENKR